MDNIKLKKRVNVTIALSVIWLFCILLYFIFSCICKINLFYTIIIFSAETVLSLALILFINIKIDWLVNKETGKDITFLNISNILSSIRLLLVPLLILIFGLIIKMQGVQKLRISIFILALLVSLTDLFDGFFARLLNEKTKIGEILDPLGDFFMILCFSILIFINNIISWWFFVLILIRIPGLVIGSLILIAFGIKFKIKKTPLGKLTIFYITCMLGACALKLLLNINFYWYDMIIFISQIIGSVIIILSSIEKISQLFHNIKNQDKLSDDRINF